MLIPGKTVDKYSMRCMGDEVSLYVNQQEVTTYRIIANLYTEGRVGFSIASKRVFPIDIRVMEAEISKQP